jgi:hypothetical protein
VSVFEDDAGGRPAAEPRDHADGAARTDAERVDADDHAAEPAGLYRVVVPRIPRKTDTPVVEVVLRPGDPLPSPVGGVVVGLSAPRVGPGGIVSVVAGIGGGAAASAILAFAPSLP